MRSVEDIRRRLLETLASAIRNPGMYAGSDAEIDGVLHGLLRDIAFVDERQSDLEAVFGGFAQRGYADHGRLCCSLQLVVRPGVAGIAAPFCSSGELIASTFAELSFRMGYLELDTSPVSSGWDRLQDWLRGARPDKDIRWSDVAGEIGPACLRIGSGRFWTDCYCDGDPQHPWVCFDYHDYLVMASNGVPARWEYDRDPILRSIRSTEGRFEEGWFVTPYGRRFIRPELLHPPAPEAAEGRAT